MRKAREQALAQAQAATWTAPKIWVASASYSMPKLSTLFGGGFGAYLALRGDGFGLTARAEVGTKVADAVRVAYEAARKKLGK